MTPLAITLRNFKSFKKEQRFVFPRDPGLYFMLGVNEVDRPLQANGAGKSTIWDALSWCLYDKTTKGLKAGDVANWDIGKDVEVALEFIEEGIDCVWTITRTWKPNSWKLSHVAEFVTDEEVIDLAKDPANPVLAQVRLEFEPFLQSILMAQGQSMFLDLKREPQAELFSKVLGLDRWMEYSHKASKKAADQDGLSRELENRLARLEGELANLGKTDFKKSADSWEVEREKRLSHLDNDYNAEMRRRKGRAKALEQAQEREKSARKAMTGAEIDPRLEDHAKRLREDAAESKALLNELQGRLKETAEHLQALLDKGDDCPTCGQPWSNGSFKDHVDEIERKVKRLKEQIEKEGDLWIGITGRLSEEEDALEQMDARYQAARSGLDDANRGLSNARRDLELCDRELDQMEDRAEAIEAERNPYKEMEEDSRAAGRKLRVELDDVREKLDRSNSRYGLLSFWVRGFKELRLQEIAEALTELEIEVNSCVTALGLVDWELRFAVDRETKGGGLQRGFSVSVQSPHNPGPTPWEAWSGGEAQRLRLAANMGLADLIRGRSGSTLNLEVWDEPTNGLSPQGVHDLLESLKARAMNEGRIIFLVDHKAHDFGGFDGQYTIVKAPSGSRIRYGAV